MKLLLAFVGVAVVSSEIYFKEDFSNSDWESRWIESEHKSDYGKWILSAGKYYNNEEHDKGLQTRQDAKFYAISSKFNEFSNKGKNLVIQFSVKHEQDIDCGGGYIKLFPSTLNQKEMHGDSKYNIMFGPDICGSTTKKVHAIFWYRGINRELKREVRCRSDDATHVYTLIVKPDNTYEILIDNGVSQSGDLEEDWEFLKPKQIKDPDVKKPSREEWDEREKIPDPAETKPEDWDQPELIVDPDGEKPDDWDDEVDGEWEAPRIDNPEYRGEWEAPMIDNPDYKGIWSHPMIDNPSYKSDETLYLYKDIGVIGLDLWQVKSGTIFDNFFITDDIVLARSECDKILQGTVAGEREMKKAKEEEERKAAETEEDEDMEDIDENDGELKEMLDDEEEETEEMDEEKQPKDEL